MKIITLLLLISLFRSEIIDAQTGKTVKIGNQEWMSINLDEDKFRNGDPIPYIESNEEWKKAGENKQPAWCYYDNDLANGAKYGKLYNWYAVTDPRGLCPAGWHVPSDAEWTQLTEHLGGEKKAGKKMKAKEGWFKKGNGNNSSGFTGLPSGFRHFLLGTFVGVSGNGGWWSSSEFQLHTDNAWKRHLRNENGDVDRSVFSKNFGMSVRCLKD
jgi:uncharacterized protein (TIGR02145 family)